MARAYRLELGAPSAHNYRQFDIARWAAVHNDDDIKQHYPAINALETRADKFSYGYTMGMNYFIAII